MDHINKNHQFITLQELPSLEAQNVLGAEPSYKESVQTSPQPASLPRILYSWLFEILGWPVAVACVMAVVAILAAFNRHPLQTLPFKIKLTTALSVLANVAEASIAMVLAACLSQIMWMRFNRDHHPLADVAMFDAASRGPLGGLLLLFQKNKTIKGCAGAAIGLLALAIGPFFQETVTYTAINGRALLQRCESTIPGSTPGAMYNTFLSLIAAGEIYTGGILDQALQELNKDCSSGNCTYPTFSSLGICSSCLNVTDQVKRTCSTVQDVQLGEVTGCNYTLFQDIFINNYTDATWGQVTIMIGDSDNSPQLDKYGQASIYEFSMIRNVHNVPFLALDCMLYYCVRGYNSFVNANILEEKVVSTWFGAEATTVNSIYHDIPTNTTDTGNNNIYSPPRHPTNFTADWSTTGQLQGLLQSALIGYSYKNGSDIQTTGASFIVSQIHNNLWGAANQDVGVLFDAITMQMTNKFRATCPIQQSAIGTAIGIATVLDAGWKWLSFPIIVVAATGMYLAFTMAESRYHHSMIWKAGVLPLLFHGVSVEVEKALKDDGIADDLKSMQRQARTVKVKIQHRDIGGWHFDGRPGDS